MEVVCESTAAADLSGGSGQEDRGPATESYCLQGALGSGAYSMNLTRRLYDQTGDQAASVIDGQARRPPDPSGIKAPLLPTAAIFLTFRGLGQRKAADTLYWSLPLWANGKLPSITHFSVAN